MPVLTFSGSAVLELLAHAKAASKHSTGYADCPEPGPGLLLVKDAGVYLMSNGKPGLLAEAGKPGQKVVYANGYESAKTIENQGGDWYGQFDKIKAATGGDDFVELLPAKAFDSLQPSGMVKIRITPRKMMVDVTAPKVTKP